MFAAQHIAYTQTNSFSKLVLDYLDNAETIRPFFSFRPDKEGLEAMLQRRQEFNTNRTVLVKVLKEQYAHLQPSAAVQANIEALLDEHSFTVCTAHQPNLFTGPL